MKKFTVYLILCFCIWVSNVSAQSNTVYFTKGWDSCLKSEAYYTRVWKKEDKGIAVTDYYQNGKIKMTGTYDLDSINKKQGYFKYYDEDGFIKSESNYVNNKEEGLCKEYREKGTLWLEEEKTNGKINGILKTYFATGAIKRIEHFNNGKFLDGKCFAITGADTTYYPFEVKPEFEGGEASLYKFLEREVKYPIAARKVNVQGRVRVKFIIDIDGSVKEIAVDKKGNPYLDEEAIRVVSLLPKWKPGLREGEAVKIYFAIPIIFSLK